MDLLRHIRSTFDRRNSSPTHCNECKISKQFLQYVRHYCSAHLSLTPEKTEQNIKDYLHYIKYKPINSANDNANDKIKDIYRNLCAESDFISPNSNINASFHQNFQNINLPYIGHPTSRFIYDINGCDLHYSMTKNGKFYNSDWIWLLMDV